MYLLRTYYNIKECRIIIGKLQGSAKQPALTITTFFNYQSDWLLTAINLEYFVKPL